MPIPGGFEELQPSIPILVMLNLNGSTSVTVIVLGQSAVTKDPTEPDMFSIVGDITIAAAVTKTAILEINEECVGIGSAVIVGFISEIVWLLPILLILVVAIINLLYLAL